MDFGKLRYHVIVKNMAKTILLTLVDSNDEDILSSQGLSELRKKRIVRLTEEAWRQGLLLSYSDLNTLLLSSVSTLKRDVSYLERLGYDIQLKGRRNRQ